MPIFKRSLVSTSVCVALAGFLSPCAEADITTTFSGYGTLGAAFTSDNNYQYVHDATEFSGAGHQIDVGLESKIGGQIVVDFGSGFSVTAQEVARERGDSTFSLGTEWLFVQYSPDPDWRFRLGRVALATFLFSASREVGYAAPWLNVPNEIYAAEPYQNLDGAQILWHHNIGLVGVGVEGAYGNSTLPSEIDGIVYTNKAKSMYNVAATLEYGDFLFRVAQTRVNTPGVIPITPTFSVSYTNGDVFRSAGMQYDNGKAIVLAEIAKRTENNLPFPLPQLPAAASTEWYVAGGWRFGKFTPLVSYATVKPAESLLFPPGKFSTPSVSLRYDVVTNVALKAQVSRAQAANPYYWNDANLATSERVNVFSFGADFVF